MIFTWDFWKDAAARSIRTFAQTLAAALSGSALNIWSADWHQAFGLAAGSAVVALLMAVDRSGTVSHASSPTAVVVEPVEFVERPMGAAAPIVACGDNLR